MPEVDRLQIVLDADTGEYVRDMDDAEKATREFAEESEKATHDKKRLPTDRRYTAQDRYPQQPA